jgi:hypothetical protein
MLPVPEPAVITTVLLLVQIPPGVLSTAKDELPRHSCVAPVIKDGLLFTVNVWVLAQPPLKE